MAKLSQHDKLSLKQAADMVLDFAQNSDLARSYSVPKTITLQQLADWFARHDISLTQMVETARDPNCHIPKLENPLGSDWDFYTEASDGQASAGIVDGVTGETLTSLSHSGSLSSSTYRSKLKLALSSRQRSIDNASYQDFLTSLSDGFSSIEAFLNDRVRQWNYSHPSQRFNDSSPPYLTLDEKIRKWVPIMTGGKSLDLGTSTWNSYKRLQELRNHEAIHPDKSAQSLSYEELAKQCNEFSIGICGLLFELHRLFDVEIPSLIIRGKYSPTVYA